MFDFAWSEIALIGVVALVLIGPKDMPVALKAVTGHVKKARRMAAEFQTHVDDMVKDADLGEVRDQIRRSAAWTSAAPSPAPWTRTAPSARRSRGPDPHPPPPPCRPRPLPDDGGGAPELGRTPLRRPGLRPAADAAPELRAGARPSRRAPAFIPPEAGLPRPT